MLDPYATLQVGRKATQDEVKRAYRKLAKEFHPDLHPENPAGLRRFRDICAAYELLSDEVRRRQYDRARDGGARVDAGAAEQPASADAGFEAGLDAFFNVDSWGYRPDGSSNRPRRRGDDIRQTLHLGFIEAALGAQKRVVIKDERALEVTIPPLSESGRTVRLHGQGEPGLNGAARGDLLIDIVVDSHPVFSRRDLDIHMVLPVTIAEAVLGAAVTVPTVHGLVQLKIPKGSNTDTRLRLKGKGLAGPNDAQGDHYVVLKVVLPDPQDPEFLRLVETWSKRYSYRVRPVSLDP